jgi:uncharacterized repeat protein (TIGR03917 family)
MTRPQVTEPKPPATVVTVKIAPGATIASMAASLASLPGGAVFIGGYGDIGVVLAFGPADGTATERDVLAAVVGALTPADFATPGRANSSNRPPNAGQAGHGSRDHAAK